MFDRTTTHCIIAIFDRDPETIKPQWHQSLQDFAERMARIDVVHYPEQGGARLAEATAKMSEWLGVTLDDEAQRELWGEGWPVQMSGGKWALCVVKRYELPQWSKAELIATIEQPEHTDAEKAAYEAYLDELHG